MKRSSKYLFQLKTRTLKKCHFKKCLQLKKKVTLKNTFKKCLFEIKPNSILSKKMKHKKHPKKCITYLQEMSFECTSKKIP